MAHKGFFKPINPHKYKGKVTDIVYRSRWELKLMSRLDLNENVIEWNSEGIVIPYISPIDGRRHRYFMDFYVKKRNRDGSIEICLIEVKPKYQTVPPKVQNKATKRYLNEVKNWGVNSAKWDAAQNFCNAKGWKFYIFNEDHLGIK
jgi:hypothetical protein